MTNSRLRGVPASPGRAVGPTAHVVRELKAPRMVKPADIEAEVERVRLAATEVRRRLEERARRAKGTAQAILELTAVMADDPTLVRGAQALIRELDIDAASAIWRAAERAAKQLRGVGGATAERASDVLDVRDRIVAFLTDAPTPGIPERAEPYILVANDLAPSDTAILDPDVVLAIVTAQGGPTSHMAILARELGIPAIVACEGALEIPEGTRIGVDASNGEVMLHLLDEQEFLSHQPPRFEYRGPCRTVDGVQIGMFANVGDVEGARLAAELGADGIGLLRTEYTFPAAVVPDLEEQTARYGEVFEHFPGKRVVVRTLDAGADRPLPYLSPTNEPNPALGVRGYRALVAHPHVLDLQLEAIKVAAAAHQAEVWVMAPMITTPDEAADFTARAHRAGLPVAGVMVEVPAAALRASQLLAHTDFASIGTNDLTQYTMAADRMLGDLAHLADPWSPAVLSLIQFTALGGGQQDRPVGVCGEAAADPALACVLIGLGITTLSVSPRSLAAVAAVIERTTTAQCRQLAELALGQASAAEARDAVRAALPALAELGL